MGSNIRGWGRIPFGLTRNVFSKHEKKRSSEPLTEHWLRDSPPSNLSPLWVEPRGWNQVPELRASRSRVSGHKTFWDAVTLPDSLVWSACGNPNTFRLHACCRRSPWPSSLHLFFRSVNLWGQSANCRCWNSTSLLNDASLQVWSSQELILNCSCCSRTFS